MKISTALRHTDDYVASMPAIHIKNVPQKLHDDLMRIAEQEHCSLDDVILQAIHRYLSRRRHSVWIERVLANPSGLNSSVEQRRALIAELREERDAR